MSTSDGASVEHTTHIPAIDADTEEMAADQTTASLAALSVALQSVLLRRRLRG